MRSVLIRLALVQNYSLYCQTAERIYPVVIKVAVGRCECSAFCSLRNPAVYLGITDRNIYDSDRFVRCGLNILCEIISDRRTIRNRIGVTLAPRNAAQRKIIHRACRTARSHIPKVHNADIFIFNRFGIFKFLRRVVTVHHIIVHIRLTCANPHIADRYVLILDNLAVTSDRKGVIAALGQSSEIDLPVRIFVRCCRPFGNIPELARQLYLDLTHFWRFSPYYNGFIRLDNHIAAEYRGNAEFCCRAVYAIFERCRNRRTPAVIIQHNNAIAVAFLRRRTVYFYIKRFNGVLCKVALINRHFFHNVVFVIRHGKDCRLEIPSYIIRLKRNIDITQTIGTFLNIKTLCTEPLNLR